MNGKFSILNICFLFSVLAFSKNNEIQRQPFEIDIKGAWEFEKAEYLERRSPAQPYEVKRVIEKEEDLYSLEQHFSNLIKKAVFEDEIAIVYDLFSRYCGRYSINSTNSTEKPGDKQFEVFIGNVEEIGMVYAEIHEFNAPGLRYLIDKPDEDTLRITLENMFQDDGVTIFGAVRCVLKKGG